MKTIVIRFTSMTSTEQQAQFVTDNGRAIENSHFTARWVQEKQHYKAICKQLGAMDSVTSPSFSLVNEYITTSG